MAEARQIASYLAGFINNQQNSGLIASQLALLSTRIRQAKVLSMRKMSKYV